MKLTKRNIFRFVWLPIVSIATIWHWSSFQARGVADEIFESNQSVFVAQTEDLISFTPSDSSKTQIIIFYPGGMVEPEAYAPLCRKIAENGYKCLIVKMPWRLATLGYNKPKELNWLSDTSKRYIFAGHSQGGKMAAQFAYKNDELVDGLILIGTTHPRDISLAALQVPVMKIYASNDGVADVAQITQNKKNLPSQTEYVLIEGGNHAQFGYYGTQLGDDESTISREVQQEKVVDAILKFLKR